MFRNGAPGIDKKAFAERVATEWNSVFKKGFGGSALNKQTAGNVSVYEHSHCLPVMCVAIHTHCLRITKTTETAFVPLRKTN